MQRREKILAVTAGSLLVLAGLHYAYTLVHSQFDQRWTQLDSLRQDMTDKDRIAARGKRAARKLNDWEHRSLPSDLDLARSLYQNWLLGLVDRAGIGNADVTSSPVVPRRGIYYKLPFTVRGRATLEQLTRFLHDFYSANHLHQIWRLTLNPVEGDGGAAGQLEVFLSIEALALPGADRRRELNSESSDRLAWRDLEQYRKMIVERKLFAPYKPPPPVAASSARPPAFDTAKHAFITGVTEVAGRPLVWLNVRTTGELMQLHEGDSFKVGDLEGTIARIEPQAVEIETQGKRHLVPLGKSLRDARVLPPGS